MPKPPHIDNSLYHLMNTCWEEDPIFCPEFLHLRNRLREFIEKELYLGLMDQSKYDGSKYSDVEDELIDEQDSAGSEEEYAMGTSKTSLMEGTMQRPQLSSGTTSSPLCTLLHSKPLERRWVANEMTAMTPTLLDLTHSLHQSERHYKLTRTSHLQHHSKP
ncbi:hypothetical protein P5673_032369 [Acropora cervicornis]|uniref:Serine-threonine/tyrosine-protein kinase catalytic domain-containing protein n=1 Tax=Acropora cervicornis TaxID=6130 RepID=A0AAD9PRB4_ACRCE|nr:hypothetical protein P5673_032369 [Acropora cervicornis]